MRVTIIPVDRLVMVDDLVRVFDFTIDSNIHAVQWDGSAGHIEYKDGIPNLDISGISDFDDIIAAYNAILAEEERVDQQDWPIEDLRSFRDRMLTQSDWSQIPDAQLTDAKVLEWQTYRQVLRDWPEEFLKAPERNPATPQPPSK